MRVTSRALCHALRSVATWCNQDPCGMICAMVTWGLILYAAYVNTVSAT
jgi:hypothetical protein